MSNVWHTPRNNAKTTVAVARVNGSPTLTVTDASKLSSQYPFILTAVRNPNTAFETILCILEVTGASGNTLTVSGAIEGTTDVDLHVGDTVGQRPTALAITEIQAAVDGNSASIATKAPLASPPLSGTPTAPTPLASDNSTKLATTAYVKNQGYAILPSQTGQGGKYLATDGTNPGWSPVIGMGIGNPVASGTVGAVLYVDASGNLGQDPTGLTWDDALHKFVVRGKSPQPGSLQEWQNSTGAAPLLVTSSGVLKSKSLGLLFARSDQGADMNGGPTLFATLLYQSSGTVTVSDQNGVGLPFVTSSVRSLAQGTLVGIDLPGSGINLRTTSATTANLTIAGTTTGFVGIGNPAPVAAAQLHVQAYTPTTKALIVQGAVSQSVNLQEWQFSDGTPMASLTTVGANVTLALGYGGLAANVNLNYGSSSGGSVVGMMGGVSQFVVGFNNQGIFGGTGGTSSGRSLVFYDSVANTYRFGVNANGDAIFGSSPSSYSVKIQTPSLTNTNLIVRAAPLQSANLQEWQDNTGTMLASVTSTGRLGLPAAGTGPPALSFGDATSGFYSVVAGTVSFSSGGIAQWVSAGSTGNSTYPRSFRLRNSMMLGWASGSPDTLGEDVWLNRVGVGQLQVGSSGGSGGSLIVGCPSPTSVGLVVQAAPLQSANLQEWQDGTGTPLTLVDPSGFLDVTRSGGGRVMIGYAGGIGLAPAISFGPAADTFLRYIGAGALQHCTVGSIGTRFVVKAGPSQGTINLQEWQDSSGVPLADVDSLGNLSVRSAVRLTTASLGFPFSPTDSGFWNFSGNLVFETPGQHWFNVGGTTRMTLSSTALSMFGAVSANSFTCDANGSIINYLGGDGNNYFGNTTIFRSGPGGGYVTAVTIDGGTGHVTTKGAIASGNSTTAARPTVSTVGAMWFDTTLGKPIWWNGSVWKDAAGSTV